jgi:hypothetical protein
MQPVWERAAALEIVSVAVNRLSVNQELLQGPPSSWAGTVLDAFMPFSRTSYPLGPHWHPSQLWDSRGGLVATPLPGRAASVVRPYVRWMTESSIVLDSGNVHVVDLRIGLLITAASTTRDPLKLHRAAALAGWALVPPTAAAVAYAVDALQQGEFQWRG